MLSPLLVVALVALSEPAEPAEPVEPSDTGQRLITANIDVWPRVTIKVAAGLPTWVGVHAEVNFLEGLGVEGGMNAPGVIPGSYTFGGFWRPFAYNTKTIDLRLGAGAQVFAFYDETFLPFSLLEGLAVVSGQATAAWRPLQQWPVGLFAGIRFGAGPAFSFTGTWIEPGILAELQLGVVAF